LIGLQTLIHAHCFRRQFGQNEEKTSEERKSYGAVRTASCVDIVVRTGRLSIVMLRRVSFDC